MSEILIKISAKLLTSRLSGNPDDYPPYIPNWLIYRIERHNDVLRLHSIAIRNEADKYKQLENKTKTQDDIISNFHKLLTEMDTYLSVSKMEAIHSNSVFHKEIKGILGTEE